MMALPPFAIFAETTTAMCWAALRSESPQFAIPVHVPALLPGCFSRSQPRAHSSAGSVTSFAIVDRRIGRTAP